MNLNVVWLCIVVGPLYICVSPTDEEGISTFKFSPRCGQCGVHAARFSCLPFAFALQALTGGVLKKVCETHSFVPEAVELEYHRR